jgi:tetratricopeptide (TPR) repeat protein
VCQPWRPQGDGAIPRQPVSYPTVRTLVLALLLASLGCASATLKRSDERAVARADALVGEGCYTCLIEARNLYETTLARRRPPALVQRLFEVELLLGLREKELALDAAALVRARALAKELPTALMAERYLRLAEAIPPDEVGTPRRERRLFITNHLEWMGAAGPRTGAIAADVAWLDGGLLSARVRQYLSLSLDCSYKTSSRPAASEPPAPGAPSDETSPLLAYRKAICLPFNKEALDEVRRAVPRFAEIAYFLGRIALPAVARDGGRLARVALEEAYAAFPSSPAVTYLNGSLKQMAGDCRAALRFYDETLEKQALHEDALLGRTVCLSVLGQSDAAIAVASRIIELQADNQGDAFYWRAWNRHQRRELVAARADIERAKTLRYNSSVLTLAGIIEHDQDDLAPAETDLSAAKVVDASNCVASWYMALVGLKREAWMAAATQFTTAMECYRASALDTEGRMQAMAARDDLEPEWRAAQLAGFEAALKEDRSQESASAYNAAVNYLRGGDRTKAATFADLAAHDPVRLPKVEELRKLLIPPVDPR